MNFRISKTKIELPQNELWKLQKQTLGREQNESHL